MLDTTISPGDASAAAPPWDFTSLRQCGLAYLQALALDTWTDHNAHDPGITILELLAYVLTDLAYRANYDVRDLLAGPGADASLFRAPEVLTTNPVTILDLRKLVLDVEGVKNVWIEPATTLDPLVSLDPAEDALSLAGSAERPLAVRGVYRVLVAPDRTGPGPAAIAARLNAARPLGLDFLAPEIMQEQKIAVVAEIEIDGAHLPADVLRAAYAAAADQVSPRLRFYSLEEMLSRGLTPDEIYDGPLLQRGFVDATELARAGRVTELHTSDLLARLMELPGVRAVHRLALQKEDARPEPWVLALEPSQVPVLDLRATRIALMRGRVRWQASPEEIARITAELLSPQTPPAAPPAAAPLTAAARPVGRYHSLQHHLPQVYGVGAAGLPADATPARRAQASQLGAYLLMFDQVLANSFGQVAHSRELFSFAPDAGTLPTYLAQPCDDVPLAGRVLAPGFDADALQAMLEAPGSDGATVRQQRFLDHLLARFAEDFGGYKLQTQRLGRNPIGRMEPQRAFLRDYPAVSGGLGRAFDYTRPSWGWENHANVSGLEKRIAYKLGIRRYYRRALADLPPADMGGFHLLEHILLRPGPADSDSLAGEAGPLFLAQPLDGDPYSGQLSFVFPDWIIAFTTPDNAGTSVRDYVEATVREEAPAHLSVRVLWFDRDRMAAFEPSYRVWLDSLLLPA